LLRNQLPFISPEVISFSVVSCPSLKTFHQALHEGYQVNRRSAVKPIG
jgi:hypothetical protein